MTRLVAYYRVSTKRQGASGLGLAAQKKAVEDYATSNGFELVRTYCEIESGKRKDRPELEKALSFSKRAKARLVVAKLDRLARNVAFTSALMESKVDFVACDNPHATPLTIHIIAAVAEDETRRVSERTKKTLAIAKQNGVKLGSARPGHWDGREDRRLAGAEAGGLAAAEVHRRAAIEDYGDLPGFIQELREDGLSYEQIAYELNNLGERTRRGKEWNRVQVRRVFLRSESA